VLEWEGTRPSRTGRSCAGPIAAGVNVSATRCSEAAATMGISGMFRMEVRCGNGEGV
jgi:hypothetical protein